MEIAKKAGAHHVIDLSKDDLIKSVKALTDDKGADVVDLSFIYFIFFLL